MASLVGFRHPSHYGDRLIKPARKTFDALIVKEWPNIQRILASLAQKDVTQATVVRKLSSYARQNQTKKALWELDNIRRTIHILDFIDDPTLRQSVQKALNRGEAYHRMRRAISYVNSGKFRVKTEAEQQIWNECSRLIANAIIYYNTLLLSRVYEQKLAAADLEAIKILKGISPVAWRNVNLIGNFDFTTSSAAGRHRSPGGALSKRRLLAPLHDAKKTRTAHSKIANFTFSRGWAKMTESVRALGKVVESELSLEDRSIKEYSRPIPIWFQGVWDTVGAWCSSSVYPESQS